MELSLCRKKHYNFFCASEKNEDNIENIFDNACLSNFKYYGLFCSGNEYDFSIKAFFFKMKAMNMFIFGLPIKKHVHFWTFAS